MAIGFLGAAFRALRARPAFSASVIAALGLGIGANTALFTVINSLLFRPLPYARSHELVEVSPGRRGLPLDELRQARSFSGIGAWIPRGFSVRDSEGVRNVYGNRVSADLLRVLDVKPLLGRIFEAGEEDQPVIILSYEYWRTTSGDPQIIGRTIDIGETRFTIVGVLDPDFSLQVRDANMFVPVRMTEGRMIARLSPGVSAAQAEAEVTAMLRGLPATERPQPPRVRPIAESFRPGDVTTILLLQAAVAMVLLITCSNVGNLMLVRSNARRREFAIRAAVGAGRGRLAGQIFAESTILALSGGAAGLLAAAWITEWLRTQIPGNLVRMLRGSEALAIDYRVIAFTFVAALVSAVVFGTAPALSAMRTDVMSTLRDSGRGGSPGRQRIGRLLVIAELSLALMLAIGAALMLKSLAGLERRDLGFSADHVLRGVSDFSPARYSTPEQRAAVFDLVLTRLRAIPGVEVAGAVAPQLFPFGGPMVRGSIADIRGRPGEEPRAETYSASPDYFRAVRIPLLKGRMFTDADGPNAPPVALISDVVARRYWPGEDPVGRVIRLGPERTATPWVTIIGVVGDIRNPVGADVQPTAYRPFAQLPYSGATLMIRAAGDPSALIPAVRRELLAIDPSAPEFRPAILENAVRSYINPQRFITSTLGIFAGLGVLLAVIGVYGVMRYWVTTRVPEIGVRIALGARRSDILRLVLGTAARASLAGVALGIAGALAFQKIIASQLHGVSPTDPAIFAMVTAAVAGVAIVAAAVPAIWASRVDPIAALRHE